MALNISARMEATVEQQARTRTASCSSRDCASGCPRSLRAKQKGEWKTEPSGVQNEMNAATPADLKEIYAQFRKRKDVFPHIRQDKLRSIIEAGQVVWQNGVVITYQRYKRRTCIAATSKFPQALSCFIKSSTVSSSAGPEVACLSSSCARSPSHLAAISTSPSGTAKCCGVLSSARHGMSVVGTVSWSRETLPGLVYRMALS